MHAPMHREAPSFLPGEPLAAFLHLASHQSRSVRIHQANQTSDICFELLQAFSTALVFILQLRLLHLLQIAISKAHRRVFYEHCEVILCSCADMPCRTLKASPFRANISAVASSCLPHPLDSAAVTKCIR